MIEKILISYLNNVLDVPVYAERRHPAQTPCAVIEKTGGSCTNHISDATIAIQAYADSMLGAAELIEAVNEAMLNSVVLPDIARCVLNSSFNSTHTEMKEHRYTSVFNITHY